jgi:hypothetical protein
MVVYLTLSNNSKKELLLESVFLMPHYIRSSEGKCNGKERKTEMEINENHS